MSEINVSSIVLFGIEPRQISIKVETKPGPIGLTVVGLTDVAARELRTRVRAAIVSAGFGIGLGPGGEISLDQHVTVQIDTGVEPGEASALDLPVAVGVLAAFGRVSTQAVERFRFVGELSLSGKIRPVRGLVPRLSLSGDVIAPAEGDRQIDFATTANTYLASDLNEVVDHLRGTRTIPLHVPRASWSVDSWTSGDLSELPARVGRALEIAAAGGHHLILLGPPGAGKTMAARRLPSILPRLSEEQARDIATVHSTAGLGDRLPTGRPFRAPHHTVSTAGLLGGGDRVRPGEVSLAHQGVLYLDELPEFHRSTLADLQTALSQGCVPFRRGTKGTTLPARPLVVGSAHLCPCGYAGSATRPGCKCTPDQIKAYRDRLVSLSRWADLHVTIPSHWDLPDERESSATVRERVVRARALQAAQNPDGKLNCKLEASPRARVALTIANLAGSTEILEEHDAEAATLSSLTEGAPWLT